MNATNNLIKGLQILSKYGDSEVVAEHGEIHAGPDLSVSNPIRDADEDSLSDLGWIIGDSDRWMFHT